MESRLGRIILWALTIAVLGGSVWALYATGFCLAADSPEELSA